jgi:hypothetical protein
VRDGEERSDEVQGTTICTWINLACVAEASPTMEFSVLSYSSIDYPMQHLRTSRSVVAISLGGIATCKNSEHKLLSSWASKVKGDTTADPLRELFPMVQSKNMESPKHDR